MKFLSQTTSSFYRQRINRGATFIDILLGVAFLALVFWGISGAFLLALHLVTNTKAKTGALALATEQLEFVRSLPYDAVGTVGGIPSGSIEQTELLELNHVPYTRRTFIQFVDAPEDGTGASDENGITADYKRVKVELLWVIREDTRSFSLVSNIVPKGIETIENGGTLFVNVIDAFGLPVEGAEVRVENNETSPPIDVSTFTNMAGRVIFPGSPEANSYHIIVTKPGYSTAQTYTADASNPAPSPGDLSILEGQVSEATFAIDVLSEKTVETFLWLADDQFEDSFTSSAFLEEQVMTEVSGGDLILAEDESGYVASGSAVSTEVEPPGLGEWDSFSWTITTDPSTGASFRLLYESDPDVWTPVPDTDLPGNLAYFTSSPISISSIDPNTYPSFKIEAALTSGDASSTPLIHDWEISFRATTPLPGMPFSMRGTKTIGTDGSGEAIYKYDENNITDGSGLVTMEDLEWDTYTILINGAGTGYDISESCLPQPRSIAPNVSTTTTLFLVPHTAHSLLVIVENNIGALISDANVNLNRTGFDETQQTSSCGQTFFSGISTTEGSESYVMSITASGYQNMQLDDVEVEGQTQITATLTPL